MNAQQRKLYAEARARLDPIQAAVESGDVEQFKKALFTSTPGVISERMAQDLTYGFLAPYEIKMRPMSFGELCFYRSQPEMMRIAIEAEHPSVVNGAKTDSLAEWTQQLLCVYYHVDGDRWTVHRDCLQVLALSRATNPTADDFMAIGLEFDPVNEQVVNAPASMMAEIHAAQMRIHLRRHESAGEGVSSATSARGRRAPL